MTSSVPSNFDFSAVHHEDPRGAVALVQMLLLDPDAVARRVRFARAVRGLAGRQSQLAAFEPEIDLVVNIGLASEEGTRRLTDAGTVERVSRMLDDPDALIDAHNRLALFDPIE